MITKICAATTIGVDAHRVDVEVDLSHGLMQFTIVGLPDAAIKESRQRIVTALKQCGLKLPERKITVNLSPADIKKEGTLFDLPIAVGVLQAAGYLTPVIDISRTLFVGELSLDGSVVPVKGVVAIACDAQRMGCTRLMVPARNAAEAALVEGVEVIGVTHIQEVIASLRGERVLSPVVPDTEVHESVSLHDFAAIRGQDQAKRALQICAAGNHHLLMVGSPGSGKTMLAQALPTIMEPLSREELIESTKIYSVAGVNRKLTRQRPFRAPHHTISMPGLVGGGSFPHPGEMSLAHHGVLFLDEVLEFKRSTLEVVRQPLEQGVVTIARAQQSVTFPASCTVIAATNPCPCGMYGDAQRRCVCTPQHVKKYLEKLSGPLLDRLDVQVAVPAVSYETFQEQARRPNRSSAELREGVMRARTAQLQRFGNTSMTNARMTAAQVEEFCVVPPEGALVIQQAFEKLSLSMRGYHKVLKLARTIADLEGSAGIQKTHLQEALRYRAVSQLLEKL